VTTKEYYLPQSLDEALSLLNKHGDALMLMAGGTLAMPLINEGVSLPEMVLGLRQAGLNTLSQSNGVFKIGSMTTYSQLLDYEPGIPLLKEAARNIGGWAIRNMGTIGGNLFAPPPSGDFAVALLALDAKLTLAGAGGIRRLPISEFFTGFMTNALKAREIVTEIEVPVPSGKTAYLKFGRKQGNTPAIVSIAVHLEFSGSIVSDARIALNAVGPHPFRATNSEAVLIGKELNQASISAAAAAAEQACSPFSDPIASEWYRRKMVSVQMHRILARVADGGNHA